MIKASFQIGHLNEQEIVDCIPSFFWSLKLPVRKMS